MPYRGCSRLGTFESGGRQAGGASFDDAHIFRPLPPRLLPADDSAHGRAELHSEAIAVVANRYPRIEGGRILLAAARLGCAIRALTIYLHYRFTEPLGRILGDTAMNIIIRLSSFILLCIGVQIVWDGVSALLSTIPVHSG